MKADVEAEAEEKTIRLMTNDYVTIKL